ncbi:hypothetical protein EBR43_02440 [bacterium]|nr:hypothetical protein [bacterium]NBX72064.1 hypothetical protein [bacterium]
MRNTTFSRLALFGLAAISSFAFAANTVSGAIRFDAAFNTAMKKQDNASVADADRPADLLAVSRMRLNFAGDIAKDWKYYVRVANSEASNAQLDLENGKALPTEPSTSASFSQANASWTGIENMKLTLGLVSCTNISADNDYYKPYIGKWPKNRSLGNIVNGSGNRPGVTLAGTAGPIGYNLGVWNQTSFRKLESFKATGIDGVAAAAHSATAPAVAATTFANVDAAKHALESTFDAKSLRLGYGARLTFAPKMSGSNSYGMGIGYNSAPLALPIVVTTFADASLNASGIISTSSAFNQLNQIAVDAAAVFGALQVNAGYESQTVKLDVSAGYNTPNTESKIFDRDGKANSWWIEAGYLLMGDSYKFDAAKATISGVKLRDGQAGLEIAARFGTETRKNVLALVNAVGADDFSSTYLKSQVATSTTYPTRSVLVLGVDNDGRTTDIVVSDDTAFETKMNGYVLNVNYYVNANAAIKAEFEQQHNKFKLGTAASTDSLNNKSVSTLRLRAEFTF